MIRRLVGLLCPPQQRSPLRLLAREIGGYTGNITTGKQEHIKSMADWQLMSAGCPHFQARVVYCVNSRDLPTVSEMSGNVDSAPKFLCQELI